MVWESSQNTSIAKELGIKNSGEIQPMFIVTKKIINLLISQSSRKSARIKKIWFTNVRNKHIVLYRAQKLSCRGHKPLFTFLLGRSMHLPWEKKYVLVELFSFASFTLRYTL